MHKQTIGFNWGPGAVSTAIWKGVLVKDLLLNICGGLQEGAKFVCFDGSETLPNGTYGTSLSVERTMNPMNDVMIAYEMNGARLSPDHGFPVRLIVPGVIGGRMIKYLGKIIVSGTRSDSWYHYHDNRVLPSVVSNADMAEREQWWTRPEYTINELNINSAICSPAHGSVLSISDPQVLNQEITINGYAYNGGCKKITRVEVTLDSGRSWLVTDLEHPEEWPEYRVSNDPFPRQRYWCWCFWTVKIPIRQLFKCKDIHVRAWDSTMNTQPKDLNWNLMGMMNNCWYRVQVELGVSGEVSGELVLRFIHPTVPGPESGGGWMRPKGEEVYDKGIVLKSKEAPILTTAIAKRQMVDTMVESTKHDSTTSDKTLGSITDAIAPGTACYTADMVAKHTAEDDCWIIHSGKVYDCTKFLKEHPGGADSILMNAGEDCTEDFDAIHSTNAKNMLNKFYIGELVSIIPEVTLLAQGKSALSGPLTPPSSGLSSPEGTTRSFIDPKKWQDIALVEKIHLTHNTRLFRFAFGHPDQLLGLPLGHHLMLRVKTNGSLYARAYTPTSQPDQRGHFDLVIKVYFKDSDPRFPTGGIVSQYLDSMTIGESIAIKGPIGSFTYNGQGLYSHSSGRKGKCLEIGMICGGTGLTPMYQIMQAILADKVHDTTKVSLIFGNRTEDDILMRKEIDDVGNELGLDRFNLWHVLSNNCPEDWKYGSGFISKDVIKEHLFPATWSVPDSVEDLSTRIILLCGPPPMINNCCLPALTELYGKDFVDNNVFCF
ncbi:hypothetical protein BGW38_000262 [Lunasporangiospora selenospora]|uniref:Nitrate reductase [NADPH] n=1 Tax=Lunasporangiospora selenospora TaxID=979761 RepID=A0A9P6FVY5_9FUNG|nr:hypothetical protein BGW38_000262 [Lunasporangiospora selenospora]